MANIVINRFALDIAKKDIEVSFFRGNYTHYLKGKKPTYLHEDLERTENAKDIIDWLKDFREEEIGNEPSIYFSFYESVGSEKKAVINTYNQKFKKLFIRETLLRLFLNKDLFIEPYKEGCDFCVYQKAGTENDFDKYIRYDFVIYCYYDKSSKRHFNELSISIGSEDTYFPKRNKAELTDHHKVLHQNLLLRYEEVKSDIDGSQAQISAKADFEIRKKLGIFPKPHFQFYKRNYDLIDKFVKESFSSLDNEYLKIYIPFKKLDDSQIKYVSFESNKMIFGNNQTDSNPINGMRDHGQHKKPENIGNTKLLFIYPDSESANKLFTYFSRGYRHFPGLESYVGIPAQPAEIKIKYDDFIVLPQKLESELPESSYENLIAICIMPFNKQNATAEQSSAYFKIKEILLKKNIASQFLERGKIFLENFHYYLPNISIAMLAKLGGVPWKLPTDKYNQLIIGFNIFRSKVNSFIGSAIYFDNEGLLKRIDSFEEKNSVREITQSVRNSISNYIELNQSCDSLVIHYFKPPSGEERISIEKMLSTELNLKIPIVFVEVNDVKTSTDICFDLGYDLLMPRSGTYIGLKPNEYLLFNNLRYWEKPVNPIRQEEYPVKIKIYDPSGSFPHDMLIDQIYEFSRLYWKGLKQKAQPVTTLYSKMIAEYVSHFEDNQIPDNNTAHRTIWFV
ncbi:MAG: Piwi domain-containing protein [Actinomycetota bacterium]|nr:Piwi domain-containing protein [Nitrospiraceae bacterium]MDA8157196.1 Piwi domain-containing protein [Actinomycetota bacterium]